VLVCQTALPHTTIISHSQSIFFPYGERQILIPVKFSINIPKEIIRFRVKLPKLEVLGEVRFVCKRYTLQGNNVREFRFIHVRLDLTPQGENTLRGPRYNTWLYTAIALNVWSTLPWTACLMLCRDAIQQSSHMNDIF
jgi:hypothetical protein